MRLEAAQLNAHLNQKLAPLYVICGDEPLAQAEYLDTLRQAARLQGAEERMSFVVERGFNWQKINDFAQAISLFSPKRILEISIPNGKPGVEGGKALSTLANTPFEDTTVIISLPTLEKETRNSAWWVALQQHAMVLEANEIALAALPQWIAKRLGAQNQTTSPEALQFMAQQVEGNLLAAHQEIQKLGLLYPAGEIAADAVRTAVLNVARFDAFQLGEAVLAGDAARTMRILQGLQDEGEQPVAVMNPLIWQLRPLVRVKQAEMRGENLNNAMTNARIFGERQTMTKKALARLSVRQLEAALQKLCEIDRISKGVMQGDAWLELSRLCFGLARIKARTR